MGTHDHNHRASVCAGSEAASVAGVCHGRWRGYGDAVGCGADMSKARDRYKRAKRLAWAIVRNSSNATIPPSAASDAMHDLLWPAYEQAQRAYNGEFCIAEMADRAIFGHLKTATMFPIAHPWKCLVCGGQGTTCEATASGILQPQTCVACKGSGNFEL